MDGLMLGVVKAWLRMTLRTCVKVVKHVWLLWVCQAWMELWNGYFCCFYVQFHFAKEPL